MSEGSSTVGAPVDLTTRLAWAGLGAVVLTVIGVGLAIAPERTSGVLALVGLGLPFLWLTWERPEFGLLGLMLVLVGVLPVPLPEIRALGAGLEARDIALFVLLGLLGIRAMSRRGRWIVPWWAATGPLLALIGLAAFSVLYGRFVQRVPLNLAFNEFRPFLFYLVAFLALAALERRGQLSWLLVGLFALADATAVIIVLQQSLGPDQLLFAQMGPAGWEVRPMGGGDTFGTVRVVPPGHILLHLMLVVSFVALSLRDNSGLTRGLLLLQFMLLALGSLLTYTRAQWLATAMAIVLLFVFLPRQSLRDLAGPLVVGALAVVIGSGAIASFQPGGSEFLTAISERAFSFTEPEDTLATDSLQWRAYENDQAMASIDRHPVLGTGLGASYREPSLARSEAEAGDWGLTRFIHNSYLFLLVKMGPLALVLFLWFVCGFLVLGWQALRNMVDGLEARLLVAILASVVGLLQWLFTQPHVFFAEGTATIGLMIGMAIALSRLSEKKTDALPSIGSGD